MPPGTTYKYSNPGYNTLGALVEGWVATFAGLQLTVGVGAAVVLANGNAQRDLPDELGDLGLLGPGMGSTRDQDGHRVSRNRRRQQSVNDHRHDLGQAHPSSRIRYHDDRRPAFPGQLAEVRALDGEVHRPRQQTTDIGCPARRRRLQRTHPQAAQIDGKGAAMMEMAGLAQKGGAVHIHCRLANQPEDISAVRVATGEADVLIGGDLVVSAGAKTLGLTRQGRTGAVVTFGVETL